MSTEIERELWTDAIQKKRISMLWDRVFLFIIGLAVVGILIYIGVVQLEYQQQSRRITRERNQQMQKILQSNEETEAYIRCGVKLHDTQNSNDLTALKKCVKSDTVQLEEIK